MQRTNSSTSTRHIIETADPLNALPPEPTESPLKSLAGALEGSYRLIWNKVQFVEPPKTLDDVRRLISRPFTVEETVESVDTPTEKPIVEDSGRASLLYLRTRMSGLILAHLGLEPSELLYQDHSLNQNPDTHSSPATKDPPQPKELQDMNGLALSGTHPDKSSLSLLL
jgi:hypothetical protein